jgi:transcription antitermination factor NusG
MYAHLELITMPGVIRLLEDAEGQIVAVPEAEMRVLQQLSGAGVPLAHAPYPAEGEGVHVVQGPLRGIRGVLLRGAPTTLLVPLPTLRAGVAIGIGQTQVAPNADVWGRQTPSHSPEG